MWRRKTKWKIYELRKELVKHYKSEGWDALLDFRRGKQQVRLTQPLSRCF